MPSPFPGMDPYLESSHWSSFHAELCVEIARQLRSCLPARYIALVEEQFLARTMDSIEIISRQMRPDVAVSAKRVAEERASYGTAVMDAPMQIAAPIEVEEKVHFIEIRTVEGLELVTVVELLSPANKVGKGREQYLDKRRRILACHVNLVEIDLLRSGERVPMMEALPVADYFAIVHPDARRPMAGVWPISVRERLPVLPVPLLPPDPDVRLDLQLSVTSVFDAIGFDAFIDYSRPLDPPLSESDVAWARDTALRR